MGDPSPAAVAERLAAAQGRVLSTAGLEGLPAWAFVPEPWPPAWDGPAPGPPPGLPGSGLRPSVRPTRTRRDAYPVHWVPVPAPGTAGSDPGLGERARRILDPGDPAGAAALVEGLASTVAAGLGELAHALWERRARLPGPAARATVARVAAATDPAGAPAILEAALAELDAGHAPPLVGLLADLHLKGAAPLLVRHAAGSAASTVALLESLGRQESRGLAQLARWLDERALGLETPGVVVALLAASRRLGCRTVFPLERSLEATGEPGKKARGDCVEKIRAWAR